MNPHARPALNAGFTLIEVLTALAILAVAMFVLMDAHYAALNLSLVSNDELVMAEFLENTVAKAEVEVLQGTLTDAGDFGTRYPDFSWTFDAALQGDDQVQLYEVNATVTGPNDQRALKFYVYNTSDPSQQTNNTLTGDTSGKGGSSSSSSSSSSTSSTSRSTGSSSSGFSSSGFGSSGSSSSGFGSSSSSSRGGLF